MNDFLDSRAFPIRISFSSHDGDSANEKPLSPWLPGAAGKQLWYKTSAWLAIKSRIYYNQHTTSERSKTSGTTATFQDIMTSSSKTVKAPVEAKARKRKKHRKVVLEVTSPVIPSNTKDCLFDGLSEVHLMFALQHYYEHPEEIPDRETPAMRKATAKPLRIKVTFDVNIFERAICLHPISPSELEEVDPFTLPRFSTQDMRVLAGESVPTCLRDRHTPPLDEI